MMQPKTDIQRRMERRRLDKVLRSARVCIERAATQMLLHVKDSLDDDTPRPPFSEVLCDLHEAVAITMTADDKLKREACVELIIHEFSERLRLKAERAAHVEADPGHSVELQTEAIHGR